MLLLLALAFLIAGLGLGYWLNATGADARASAPAAADAAGDAD